MDRNSLQPLILVTNDDGIASPGLAQLVETVTSLGQVVVVAPEREQSACGHAFTLNHPLRVRNVCDGWFAVDGTPTDCVNLGIHGLLQRKPALVLSGINYGSNLADDITYSGTVAAAMEAMLMGVPGIAISQDVDGCTVSAGSQDNLAQVRNLVGTVLNRGLPEDTLLNVNLPAVKALGIRLTRQGKRTYDNQVVEKTDPRGRPYYWLGGGSMSFERRTECDCGAVADGYISVSPLHLDLTNYASLAILREWTFE